MIPSEAEDAPPPVEDFPGDLALTQGEVRRRLRPVEPPKHELPAILFIFLTKLSSWGLAFSAVVYLLITMGSAGKAVLPAAAKFAGLAAGFLFQHTLAKNVENFTRWGWYGAMAELVVLAVAKVGVVARNPEASWLGAMVGITFDLVCIMYFIMRRADYGVEFG